MTPTRRPRPMTPEMQIREAKVRLRKAAGRMSPRSFYRNDPKLVLGLAFSTGVFLAVFRKQGRETVALLKEAADLFKVLNCRQLIQQLFQSRKGD